MKIGFDLDGTLDKPAVLALAKKLWEAGCEIHIITGVFPESDPALSYEAKLAKLARLGLALATPVPATSRKEKDRIKYDFPKNVVFHCVTAVDVSYGQDYRLRDIAFRKGAYIEAVGISLMFDDSDLYCEVMPKVCGATMARVS